MVDTREQPKKNEDIKRNHKVIKKKTKIYITRKGAEKGEKYKLIHRCVNDTHTLKLALYLNTLQHLT